MSQTTPPQGEGRPGTPQDAGTGPDENQLDPGTQDVDDEQEGQRADAG